MAGHNNVVASSLRLLSGHHTGRIRQALQTHLHYNQHRHHRIRGTAVYVSADPHRLYTCTCYGHTDLRMGRHVEQISTTHHNAHEIAPDGTGTMSMGSHV